MVSGVTVHLLMANKNNTSGELLPIVCESRARTFHLTSSFSQLLLLMPTKDSFSSLKTVTTISL